MKKIIKVFIIFAVSIAFAQPNGKASDQGSSGDLVEFVTVDEMPIPLPKDEIEKMKKESSSIAPDGFSSIKESSVIVKGFFNSVKAAKMRVAYSDQLSVSEQLKDKPGEQPEAYKSLSELNLTFTPSTFSQGELIAVVPSGTLIDNAWTGVERFFQISGVGVVRLTEFDQAASKGKFYMLKDAVNTDVHGKQAISKVITNGNKKIEEVVWVNGKKLYTLTFGPNTSPEDGGSKSKATAPDISALSLALELL